MLLKRIVFGVCVVAAAACAGGGATPATGAAAAASAPRRDPNVITKEDLSDPSLSGQNIYDAIKTLRPRFMATRGTSSLNDAGAGAPHVSIDGGPVGELDDLKRVQASVVIEVRLLDASQAMQRFGATAKQGPVIVIRTM